MQMPYVNAKLKNQILRFTQDDKQNEPVMLSSMIVIQSHSRVILSPSLILRIGSAKNLIVS
jgi:hypothetical protein